MQIEVFEDQRLNDEDEFGGEINLNNHNDVFQALFQKVNAQRVISRKQIGRKLLISWDV